MSSHLRKRGGPSIADDLEDLRREMSQPVVEGNEIDRLADIAPLLSAAIDNHPSWGIQERRLAYAELDRLTR